MADRPFKSRQEIGDKTIKNEETIGKAQILVKKGFKDTGSFFYNRTEDADIGMSPSALLNLIHASRLNGKSHLGHGSFEDFLKNEFGVEHQTQLPTDMDAKKLIERTAQMAEGKLAKKQGKTDKTDNEKLKEADTLLHLHRTVGVVTDEHVMAYLLHHQHGLSINTVSGVMKLSPQKARSMIQTATRHLNREQKP
ncbi:hypothetical protein HY994_04180 [Candidatus Micrarchaeota archaeon]|nr:hypothetical protein [Candidatus Micrarchaeota archaeon]